MQKYQREKIERDGENARKEKNEKNERERERDMMKKNEEQDGIVAKRICAT